MTKATLLVYLSAIALGVSGAGHSHAAYGDVDMVRTQDHQPIKARVLNEDPAQFTINVKNLSNMGVNEDAPTFAVYTSSRMPQQCADFSSVALRYEKPEKYHRKFNLSQHRNILTAIKDYNCVVIKNIPSQ